MKSSISSSKRGRSVLLKSLGVLLCLLLLAGCSGGNGQTEVDQSELKTENDQLTAENEKMRAELNKTSSELKTAEARIKELEDELAAMQEEEEAPPESEPPAAPDPPDRSSSDLLLGEWFFSEFAEVTEYESNIESLVFKADGTGVQYVTFYLLSELNSDNFSSSNPKSELLFNFSWTLSGDTIHTLFGDGVVDTLADFEFSPEEERLKLTSINGEPVEGVYVRERPAVAEGYVEASVIYQNMAAQEAAYQRRFLGTWYFDLTVWTFNDDGTGIWDIPEWGDQPAVQREFTYSATENMLVIDWADTGETAYFWPETNANGSIRLKDGVMLTRRFDPANCPVSTDIISGIYDAMTGQMFSDILGDFAGDAAGDIVGDGLGEALGDLVGSAVGEALGN